MIATEPKPQQEIKCEELVRRYQIKQDKEALSQLIDRFMPMVKKMVRQSSGKRQGVIDLEDLRSAGTLGITNAVHEYHSGRGTFSNWCYLKVRWSIADELRKSGVSSYMWAKGVKREPLHESTLLTSDVCAGLDFVEMIGVCREVLTDQQLCVVVCHYGEGMTFGSVAALIGVPPWRISELHQSALDKMGECFAFMRESEAAPIERERSRWRIIRFGAPSEFGLRYFATDAIGRAEEVYEAAETEDEGELQPHDLHLFVVAKSGEDLKEKLELFLYQISPAEKPRLQRQGIFF